MKVTIIDATGVGTSDPADYAASILIFTKNTRLEMKPGMLEEIRAWTTTQKMDALRYMANTIPSSWEMVNYTFLIEDVTRAFTHQLVRTRTASFAQQTMRVLNVDGWTYGTGPTVESGVLPKAKYDSSMKAIGEAYNDLISMGAKIEDARGILPTNIHTNIVMSCNMRVFVELVRKRTSVRTQGEYRLVLDAMQEAVLAVHPWMYLFLNRTADQAIKDLESAILQHVASDKQTDMIKLLDQLRTQS